MKVSWYNWRALVEADSSRFKRVIGDALRGAHGRAQATEVVIAADVLNRMLDLGRPEYVRIAWPGTRAEFGVSKLPTHATRSTGEIVFALPPIRALRSLAAAPEIRRDTPTDEVIRRMSRAQAPPLVLMR